MLNVAGLFAQAPPALGFRLGKSGGGKMSERSDGCSHASAFFPTGVQYRFYTTEYNFAVPPFLPVPIFPLPR